MSVASKLITIAENLRAKLDAINVKLTAKGQTEAANFDEVPAKIEAIETKKQDVLNLVSGITKYTDSFEINGELRSNVLVQPSDFSDESTITWSSSANSYFSHSIENIEGSENGSVMVLNPVKTTQTSVYNLFWFNSTVDASTSESRTYLIAVRAKASETITSYFPNMAITYYPTGSTGSRFLYFSYTPTTEWQTFYVIANIPENYYLKDITMCFCSRGITHYIDWIAAYDITGIDFDHMTFGANATATTSDVLSGKTFYKDGVCYTGTIATATQATPNINVSPTGLITASATQSAGYVSSGTKEATKQLSTKSAATYTPSTSNQTISSGYYLTGAQTIKGDSNLVTSNIKSGVSIFGVSGNAKIGYFGVFSNSTQYCKQITISDSSFTNLPCKTIIAMDGGDGWTSKDGILTGTISTSTTNGRSTGRFVSENSVLEEYSDLIISDNLVTYSNGTITITIPSSSDFVFQGTSKYPQNYAISFLWY